MSRTSETPLDRVSCGIDDMPTWLPRLDAAGLRDFVIDSRVAINRLEAMNADATRRFEKLRGYEADGAVGMVPWMMAHERLSGGQAAQRVEVARQLAQLPRTEEALARGEIGFEHAVAMAKTAANVGASEVRKAEVTLLRQAQTMNPGEFVNVAKSYEHQVDQAAALAEANRAHERRYLRIGAPHDGLVRLEGQVTTEQGAVIRTAMEPFMKPSKSDERTSGQRAADALTEACRGTRCVQRNGASGASANGHDAAGGGHGPRPQLIIKASIDTLVKTAGAPAGELAGGGTVPAETVRRIACDAAITRIIGLGELEHEIRHAARTTPPATRWAMVVRDRHCVFPGCDRPPSWCDSHHLVHWADGGPTRLENLALLCRRHHRRVHEDGWRLAHDKDGRWRAIPPVRRVPAHARSD